MPPVVSFPDHEIVGARQAAALEAAGQEVMPSVRLMADQRLTTEPALVAKQITWRYQLEGAGEFDPFADLYFNQWVDVEPWHAVVAHVGVNEHFAYRATAERWIAEQLASL